MELFEVFNYFFGVLFVWRWENWGNVLGFINNVVKVKSLLFKFKKYKEFMDMDIIFFIKENWIGFNVIGKKF